MSSDIAVAGSETRSDPDRPELSSLGDRVRVGAGWKAASQITTQLSRLAMTVILAHLLTPSDFGLAGMVLLFTGLIQLLADVGFSASVVQLPTLSEEDKSTAFWTSLAVALVLFGIAFAVAPDVAAFYHAPRLRWMFVAVAAGFITTALSTVQAALLLRRMNFRALEIRGMAATVVAAAVGIGAAAAGLGAWSLILQANALSVTSVFALWFVSGWRPRATFSLTSLRRMAGFSTNVLFARFLDYGSRNADNMLVGRFLGSSALGIYAIGYSVIIIPLWRFADPIRNLLTPALAALQHDRERMRQVWLRGVRTTASLIFPAMAGVIVVCPDFVAVVLGNRWAPAMKVIQVLAWVALIQSASFLCGTVYQSLHRSGLLLRMNAIAFAFDVSSFIVGLHWGVLGVAVAYALVNTFVNSPVRIVLAARLLECPLRAIASELRGVAEATILMACVTLGFHQLLESYGIGSYVRLASSIVVGFTAYVLACRWREPRVIAELRSARPLRGAPA